MTGVVRQKVRARLNNNQKQLTQNWEGYHLREFAKTVRPIKQDTKRRKELDDQLVSNGIDDFQKIGTLAADQETAFTTKKSEAVFEGLAAFQDIPTFVCFINFLEFCRNSEPYRPLDVFDGEIKLTTVIGGKLESVTLDYAIDDFKKHAKAVEEKLKRESSQDGVEFTDSTQPQLTIPQADEENKNYYASMAIKEVIGRDKQKGHLEAFLECNKNITWFQLAGEAGQGKSRLAFDLMHKALNSGWRAGFLEEDDIDSFKDYWKDWQPDKPHLLIFDYVIGREKEIKHIFNVLIPKPPDQSKYQHNIRILLLERQRWDQGAPIKIQDEKDNNELKISAHISDKANWFLKLCKEGDFEAKSLKPYRFKDGIEELKKLDENDLLTIVKQLFSGKELTISDDALKQTLKRIDSSGRPLYAYLLAQQLSDSQKGYQSWTKIDLLNYQLIRDKKRRWRKAFKGDAPTWGGHHPAMKLAVLATITREVRFQDDQIEQYFGKIDSPLVKEAVAITSGYLVKNDNCPYKIHALEPDLLGTWFVLFCFYKGLGFRELLNLAWQYSPKNTAVFLLRITQDFIDLPKEYKSWDVTEKLLAQIPFHKDHYPDLANVSMNIAYNLYRKKLTIPKNIIAALECAVNLSNSVAMTFLGFLYYNGISVTRNSEISVDLFRQAANLGNSQAMFNLGLCFENGIGVEQDWNEAARLYRQAVDLGVGQALNNLGFCFEKGKGVNQDWDEAARLYRQAADLGDSHAMVNLGIYYQDGKGIKQNWDEAVRLYQQAIDLGNIRAMVNLGVCFEKGKGVGQDWNEAARLYRQAVDLGNSRAMINLGFCYQEGEGVDQDWNEAVRLYRQAVNLGDSQAMVNLGACYQRGEGVDQDWNEAIRFYRQAVDLGNSQAMVNLGFCYLKGEGVDQDWNEAIRLYQQAVDLGDSMAMTNLGFCYQNGEGVDQDWNEAIRFYRQAVDLGDSRAMVNLSLCYLKGEGVDQNWNKAISLYQRVIETGEIQAIDELQSFLLLQSFLNKDCNRNQNIKIWPNNKCPHLTVAPEFDPPIMAGTWKKLTAKDVTAHLNKAMASFEILDLIQKLDGYCGQYGRFISLNFYQNYYLVDIQLYNPSIKNTLLFSAITNTEHTVLLDGKLNIIYGINPYLLTFNKKQSSLNYLQFFCSYIQHQNEPFQIISHLDEIPFNDLKTSQPKQAIEESFFTPKYIEGCFESEGWQKFETCMLYRNTLYVSSFKVYSNGMVSMEDDKIILNEIPILRRRYDGVLRTPLRPI